MNDTELLKFADDYLANNAAETGSDELIRQLASALRLASRQEVGVEELARVIDPIAFGIKPSMYGLSSQQELEMHVFVSGARGVARDKARALLANYSITKALSAVGDEAKKSEGRTDEAKARADAVASGSASHENHGSQIQTGVGSERSSPSDTTAERREIVARELMEKWPGDYAWGDGTREPNELAFETADAILAALDGGAGA